MLEIRVLGRLSVQHAGSAAAIRLPASRRARELLAYLATHPGTHGRSALAARFWPDVPEASARSSLRGALTELRRSLGPDADALTATREAVGLDADRVRIDLIEFRRLTAARRWREALELDHGRLLTDVDHDWAEWLRTEHTDALAAVLGELADECAADGRVAEAVALTRRRVRLDPLSESAASRLIQLLVAAGDRPAAIEAGRTLAERLQRELGVKPSAETSRLLSGLHATEVAADAEETGVSGPTAPDLAELAAPRLVGRSHQLAHLRALRRRSRLHAAVLRGAAGIGKTSLAVAAAHEAAAEGCLVLYGRCDEEGIVPYCAWIEALGPAVENLDDDLGRRLAAEGGAQLLRWFPGLHQVDEPAPGTAAPPRSNATEQAPDGHRWRLFEAVTRLLVRLSLRQPVVLVLDDVHWADRSTLLLLRHVVRTTQEAAVTIIATTRGAEADPDAPMHAVLAQLRRDRLLTEIDVPGLTQDQVAELVDLHIVRPDRAGLTDALYAETEGNPFFVSEILRNLSSVDSAAARRPDGGFVLSAGIRDLLQLWMRRLDPAARELLGVAAVVGRDFDLDTVATVSGQAEQQVLASLEAAARTDLVDEVGVGRFSFAHSLIRAALYDDLSRTRRARLHARVAEALEARQSGAAGAARVGPPVATAAELAHHFLAAHDPAYVDLAVGYSRQAHVEAMSALAYTEAAASTRRTIEAVRGWSTGAGPAHPAIGAMLLELGDALSRAGDTAGSRQAYAEAADVARAQDQPVPLATAALGYAGPSWQGFGTVEVDTIALLEEALDRVPDERSSLRTRLTARLAIASYFTHQPERLQELSANALAQARRLADDDVLAAALEARLWAQWRPDRISERIEIANELVLLAQRSGLAEAAMTGRRWRVFALMETGDVAAAWREADRHAADAHRLQLPYELMYVAVFGFARAVLENRMDDAALASTQVRVYGEMRGGADAVQLVGVHAITHAYLNGQLATLVDAVGAFAAGYPAVPGWRAALAVTQLAAGDRDAAAAEIERLWPPEEKLPFDAVWLAAMGFLSLAVVMTNDVDRARRLSVLLQPFVGRPVVLGAGGAFWGTVDGYLSLLEGVSGDLDAARRYQARAVADLSAMGADLGPIFGALGALVPAAGVSR